MAPRRDVADATAHTAEDQFLDLIYADADLLTAEFDAIIAAAWPDPPADRARPGAAGGQPGIGAVHRAAVQVRGPVYQPRHPGIGGWARQRSPPAPTKRGITHTKAGDRPR